MPIDWGNVKVDISEEEFPQWVQVREIAKEVIEKVAPNASVYSSFDMEFDPDTLQRKVAPALRGINDDSTIYHAWMLGITSATLIAGETGQTEFVGGYSYTWKLGIEWEGFFDPEGDDPWIKAETEAQLITAIFYRNMHSLMENVRFGPIEWPVIDLEAFADGNNLIVCQGNSIVHFSIDIQI